MTPIRTGEMRYFLPFFLSACLMQVNADDSPHQQNPDSGGGEETGSGVETGETAETDPPVHEWQLDAVAPPWGSNAGGDELVLSGSGFTEEVRVQIEGQNVPVLTWSETELTVISPAFSGAGEVSVGAVLGESEQVLENAFTYYEDATGLAAGSGLINYNEYMGDYWASSQGNASGVFLFWQNPSDLVLGDFAWGVTDGCKMNATNTMLDIFVPDSDTLVLLGGGKRIELDRAETGVYVDTEIDLDKVKPDQTYELLPIAGPYGFDVSSEDFVKTTRSFSIDKPELGGEHTGSIEQKNLDFEWDDATGDMMFGSFLLACPDETGTHHIVQSMTCASPDPTGAGSFELDGSLFTHWQDECLLYVYMSSVNSQPDTGPVILPQNRAELRMAAAHTMVGALWVVE
jgi:hypothetical protein